MKTSWPFICQALTFCSCHFPLVPLHCITNSYTVTPRHANVRCVEWVGSIATAKSVYKLKKKNRKMGKSKVIARRQERNLVLLWLEVSKQVVVKWLEHTHVCHRVRSMFLPGLLYPFPLSPCLSLQLFLRPSPHLPLFLYTSSHIRCSVVHYVSRLRSLLLFSLRPTSSLSVCLSVCLSLSLCLSLSVCLSLSLMVS